MIENMPLDLIADADELRHKLRENGLQYILDHELPSTKVYLQFEGMFLGKSVVWNSCIRTIAEYSQNNAVADDLLSNL